MATYGTNANMLALIAQKSKGPEFFKRRQMGEERALQLGKATMDIKSSQQMQKLRKLQIEDAEMTLDERKSRKKRLEEIKEDYKTFRDSKEHDTTKSSYEDNMEFYRQKTEEAMLAGDEKLAQEMKNRYATYASWQDYDDKKQKQLTDQYEKIRNDVEDDLVSLSRGYLNAQKEGRGQEYLEQNVPELRNKYKNSEMLDGLPEDYTDSEFWTNQSVDTLVEADKLREGKGSKRIEYPNKFGEMVPLSVIEKEWKQSKRLSELWMAANQDPATRAQNYPNPKKYKELYDMHTRIINTSLEDYAYYSKGGIDITGKFKMLERQRDAALQEINDDFEDLSIEQAQTVLENITKDGVAEVGAYTYTMTPEGKVERSLIPDLSSSVKEELLSNESSTDLTTGGGVNAFPERIGETIFGAIEGSEVSEAMNLSNNLVRDLDTGRGNLFRNPRESLDKYLDNYDIIKNAMLMKTEHRDRLNKAFIGLINRDIEKANNNVASKRRIYEKKKNNITTKLDQDELIVFLNNLKFAEAELRKLQNKKEKLLLD